MIPNLLDLQPNKVSVDLTQYSMIIMGDTGVGKTMSTMKFLKELVPDPASYQLKDPFRVLFSCVLTPYARCAPHCDIV